MSIAWKTRAKRKTLADMLLISRALLDVLALVLATPRLAGADITVTPVPLPGAGRLWNDGDAG